MRLPLSRFSHLGKEFVWISIGQGAAVIGGLVGLRLLTNYLSPATFGEIALIMTLATLVNQLLFGPLAGAVLRFLAPAHEAGAIRAYLDATRQLTKVVTLLVAAFTAVFIGPNAMIEAGYDRTNPYMSGIVKLAEGPFISAQILGLDAVAPDVDDIGTPLTVQFIERGDGEAKRTFLAFATQPSELI
jgi:O-antigen/teichoic acid export membrane protein